MYMRNKNVKIKLVIIKLVKLEIIFIQAYKKNNCDIYAFFMWILIYNINSYYCDIQIDYYFSYIRIF